MHAFIARLINEPKSSLGRFFECLFRWGCPEARGNPRDAEIILTQAASNLLGNRPSITNQELAIFAARYVTQLEIPVFPQAEVGQLLAQTGIVPVGTMGFDTNASLFSSNYMGSGGVAMLQKAYCDEHALTKILVVAPYPHFWRVLWTYERLGLTVIIPPNTPRMHFEREYVHARWSRSVTAYSYEFLARMYFFYKGII